MRNTKKSILKQFIAVYKFFISANNRIFSVNSRYSNSLLASVAKSLASALRLLRIEYEPLRLIVSMH